MPHTTARSSRRENVVVALDVGASAHRKFYHSTDSIFALEIASLACVEEELDERDERVDHRGLWAQHDASRRALRCSLAIPR